MIKIDPNERAFYFGIFKNDVIHNIYPDLFHYQFIYTNVETVFLSLSSQLYR